MAVPVVLGACWLVVGSFVAGLWMDGLAASHRGLRRRYAREIAPAMTTVVIVGVVVAWPAWLYPCSDWRDE